MRKTVIIMLSAAILAACSSGPVTKVDSLPPIEPDYTDVTIPCNIAPMNFCVPGADRVEATFTSGGKTLKVSGKEIGISPAKWHRFLPEAGNDVQVSVCAEIGGKRVQYEPFALHVAEEIDPYVAYRLIEPGYEVWGNMGLYQRNLTNFKQSAILTNEMTDRNCMNCHSFCNRNSDKMVFHMRAANGGTYYVEEGNIEKLNTKTEQTISALVYPQWHPQGRYIAFSTNSTSQAFHSSDPNRIEVYDSNSDVVVYDTKEHRVISCDRLKGADFETFPTFSPDGKWLYFSTARKNIMPFEYRKAHYSLCRIAFDAQSETFGEKVDTLYNVDRLGGSVSFPRVSPDGNYLMFTLSEYGNFSIWHKESDLCLMDLRTGEFRRMEKANSPDVDSYHSWSSNGRWAVFSSRRGDGLYTRLYLTHIDENGNETKAFIIPQRNSDYYRSLLKSYNIPEFVDGEVCLDQNKISTLARKNPGINLIYEQK